MKGMTDDLLRWRSEFPIVETCTYLVSHSLGEIQRMCTRAIWIDDGRIREDGKPVEVVRSYARAMETEPDDMKRFTAV